MYLIYFSEIKGHDKIKPEDHIKLEILPEKFTCNGGKSNIVHNMLGIGEVVEPGKRKVKTWQINSVFEPDGEETVEFYRDFIVFLSETREPFQLMVVRKNVDGSDTFKDSAKVVLEDYEFEERAGEIGILHYKIKLKEYIEFISDKTYVNGKAFIRLQPTILNKR